MRILSASIGPLVPGYRPCSQMLASPPKVIDDLAVPGGVRYTVWSPNGQYAAPPGAACAASLVTEVAAAVDRLA